MVDFRSERVSHFYLKVIPMFPTKFQVTWLFDSGDEAKKIYFQDGRQGG